MFLQSFFKAKSFFGLFIFVFILFLSQQIHASTIGGFIYDNHRIPLPNVYVELQDEFYRRIRHIYTDGSGRYQFDGLSDGNYYVKTLPFQYDLRDESRSVEINTISIRGSGQGSVYLNEDFYLQPKKGSLADAELGVVFAQEIPKEAENLYEQSVKDISKNRRDEGVTKLREAIKVFPSYYLALSLLGRELTVKGEYGEAAPILLKAVEVNAKSPTTLYYLGFCLHKLNYNKPALTALSEAYNMAPASMQVAFTLGKVERLEGKYEDAEKHLLKAKKLTNEDFPDLHFELAQLYGLNLKKYKEAVDELEKYLKAGNFDAEYTKKIKKLIADYQEKADQDKTTKTKS